MSTPHPTDRSRSARGASITSEPFGRLPDGRQATLYTLRVASGASLSVTDYGGIVTALRVPDRDGALANVVLGFDTLDGYLSAAYRASDPHLGGIIGRVANRIAGGRFPLDGREVALATNEQGINHLHGGSGGFDVRLWRAEPLTTPEAGPPEAAGIRFSRTSPDGEEGYPGALHVEVTYTLTNDHQWTVEYRATTDAPTVVNLTQHSYFNLSGDDAHSILGHEVAMRSAAFLPIDARSIPTGVTESVTGTPFDLRDGAPLAQYMRPMHPRLAPTGGYDHTFVLAGGGAQEAARVRDPHSGRTLTAHTTAPGVQLYTANHLDGSLGKGARWDRHGALCLETQNWPDAPNQPGFPSAVLRPGEVFASRTVYAFGTE